MISKFWLLVAISFAAVGVALVPVGLLPLGFSPFIENLVAEAVGLTIALGIAIMFIEGRFLSEQARRRRIISRLARDLIRSKAEGFNRIPIELGRSLASILKPQIDFDLRVERISAIGGNDWESYVRPALFAVFHQAQGTVASDLNFADVASESDYRDWVRVTDELIREMREPIFANLDLAERLLELIDALGSLEEVVRKCMYPERLRAEDGHLQGLGDLGMAYVRFLDKLGNIYKKL